ncbi:MAG: alpha/beta hydrolase [Anaerolineae bacterium]|nr:alpha/beta hydrolase [Anaerolineae bacterium]
MSVFATDNPQEVLLWPGVPPFAFEHDGPEKVEERPPRPDTPGGPARPNRGITRVSAPTLAVHRPTQPNGAAVVICPGGGFRYLEIDKEGHVIARWLRSLGITGLVLKYRTRPDRQAGPRAPMAPEVYRAIVADGLRAVRLTRANALAWALDPARIGVMGFSAGGRLAATLATWWDRGDAQAADPVARVSARPDFAALIYPGMRDEIAAAVRGETPPIFMAVADDDPSTPPDNCLRLYMALRRYGVSGELHIYRRGGHGFGLGLANGPADSWSERFAEWLRDLGVI